jgi:hypothetical protein
MHNDVNSWKVKTLMQHFYSTDQKSRLPGLEQVQSLLPTEESYLNNKCDIRVIDTAGRHIGCEHDYPSS